MTSFENPMQDKDVKNEIKKKKRDSRMKKVRKKLSIGARVKQNSHGQNGGGGGGGSMGGEVKTAMKVEAADSISVEVTTKRRADEGGAGEEKVVGEKITKRKSFRKIENEHGVFQDVVTEELV